MIGFLVLAPFARSWPTATFRRATRLYIRVIHGILININVGVNITCPHSGRIHLRALCVELTKKKIPYTEYWY